MDRRRVLGSLAGSTPFLLSGCIGSLGLSSCSKVTVDATRVEAEAISADTVVEYSELPTAEQELVDVAISENEYDECVPPSDALASFVERVRAAVERAGADSTPTVYIRKDSAYYGLEVTVEDQVVSNPS